MPAGIVLGPVEQFEKFLPLWVRTGEVLFHEAWNRQYGVRHIQELRGVRVTVLIEFLLLLLPLLHSIPHSFSTRSRD